MRPFNDPAVQAHFDAYPRKVRPKMLALRELIFDTAAQTEGVGELLETLKWGEPAYVTEQSRSGSTVRIDWKARTPEQYAVYFNCNTNLVEQFKSVYANVFAFEGNRALVLMIDQRVPTDSLSECIAAALVYHDSRKRAPRNARRRTAARK